MARERGVDGEASGLFVAYLTDHDDVGVLTYKATQSVGKGESYFGTHLRLVDAFHLIFNRVFDGGDIYVGRIHEVEQGVERRGFAGTGRAAGKYHTRRRAHRRVHLLKREPVETDALEREAGDGIAQEAHDDLLAVVRL